MRKHERLHEQNDHLTQLQPTKLYQKHPDETSETNYSAQHHEESEESGEKSGGFHSCSKCPLVSHNVGLFSRHRMRHGGGFARECDECDYSCNTFRGLKQHKLLHQRHNNPINSLKNDLTAEDRELEEKVPKLHLNLRQLQCQQCSFTTNTREALVLHLKKVHKLNQRRLQCHKCDFSSTSRVTLEQHKDVHVGDESLQIHQCHLCNYSALESHQLAVTMLSICHRLNLLKLT